MRPLPILFGILAVTIGLAVYTGLPTIHQVPTIATRSLSSPERVSVAPDAYLVKLQNLTGDMSKSPRVLVNLTITVDSGNPSDIGLRISDLAHSETCVSGQPPSGCVYSGVASSNPVNIALNESGQYYFVFDNTGRADEKVVIYSVSVSESSVENVVTKDGLPNFLGLGLGVVGLFAIVYGASRKTVIPWE